MNANEALLNVIELPKVLSGVNRPYIDWGCFVLQTGCYRSLTGRDRERFITNIKS